MSDLPCAVLVGRACARRPVRLPVWATVALGTAVNASLEGTITTTAFAVAVSVLRCWKQTAGRLFPAFAVGFALFGASAIALSWRPATPTDRYGCTPRRPFAALIVAVLDNCLSPRPGTSGRWVRRPPDTASAGVLNDHGRHR